jgi:hypothetical protein
MAELISLSMVATEEILHKWNKQLHSGASTNHMDEMYDQTAASLFYKLV